MPGRASAGADLPNREPAPATALALAHARHRLFVGHDACRVGHSIALVIRADANDVIAFAVSGRSDRGGLQGGRAPSGELVFGRRPQMVWK